MVSADNSQIVHPLESIFEVQVDGAAAETGIEQCSTYLSSPAERHGREALYGKGEQRNARLPAELGSFFAIRHAASVRARKSEAELIHNIRIEHMHIVQYRMARVLYLGGAAA